MPTLRRLFAAACGGCFISAWRYGVIPANWKTRGHCACSIGGERARKLCEGGGELRDSARLHHLALHIHNHGVSGPSICAALFAAKAVAPLLLLPPLPPPLVATICSGRAQGTSATSRFGVQLPHAGNLPPSRFAHLNCDGVYRYHPNCRLIDSGKKPAKGALERNVTHWLPTISCH